MRSIRRFISQNAELPLLKRELIELAQRKRTYTLRCVCLAIFTLVFMFAYMAMRQSSVSLMTMLGHGRDMMYVLFFMLMFTVYALAPALACSAITTEKEKQTLGLLLTSKLSPFAIVLEKTFSRMVPLLSLVVVSAPLFGLSYLFGGISFGESMLGVGFLLYVVFQVTAVAVFCSALVETSLAAFWLTYGVLLVMYFTLPIVSEMAYEFGLVRGNSIGGTDDYQFLLFPPYQIAMLSEANFDVGDVWWLTIPSLLLTLCFPIAAWLALKKFAYGSATSLRMIMLRIQGILARPMANSLPEGRLKVQAEQAIVDADSPLASRPSTDFPQNQPIVWREKRSTVFLRFRMQFLMVACIFVFQGCTLSASRSNNADEFCALFSFGVLIVCLLMVLSLASRLFGKERERQTLDSLLAAPFTNDTILRDKTLPINRLILFLLIPMLLTGLFNIFTTPVRISTLTQTFIDDNYRFYGPQSIAHGFDWFGASIVYLVAALGNAFIYMHLVKWISILFGLKLNTQMKAMIGSLVTVLVLCFVPLILIALLMISTDSDPDDFPFWFFSSPIFSVGFNEFHDLNQFWRRNYLPDSDGFVVLFNFGVYGGLTLLLRAYVLNQLSHLLGRVDQSTRAPKTAAHEELWPA